MPGRETKWDPADVHRAGHYPVSSAAYERPSLQTLGRHHATDAQMNGQLTPAVPSTRERLPGHLPYHSPDDRRQTRAPVSYSADPSSYTSVFPFANAAPRETMHLFNPGFSHRASHQQLDYHPGTADAFLPSQPRILLPSYNADMPLHPGEHNMHTPGRTAYPSHTPSYPHEPGKSLPASLHTVADSANHNGHESRGQGPKGTSYEMSLPHASQADPRNPAPYPMPNSTCMSAPESRALVPLDTGLQQPPQEPTRSNHTHSWPAPGKPGDAAPSDNAGAHAAPERWRKRLSDTSQVSRASEMMSPESDASNDTGSRYSSSKASRAPFTEQARRETGATRKTGACIRCRLQRSRVSSYPPPGRLDNARLATTPC
jgi:hypothetical protein